MYSIEQYKTPEGRIVFREWHGKLRDIKAKIAIDRRIGRLAEGNFGDHKFCRDGVWELRIDVGPGYRLYYAMAGATLILLLCGGDKRTRGTDIDRACEYWKQWQGDNDAKRTS